MFAPSIPVPTQGEFSAKNNRHYQSHKKVDWNLYCLPLPNALNIAIIKFYIAIFILNLIWIIVPNITV